MNTDITTALEYSLLASITTALLIGFFLYVESIRMVGTYKISMFENFKILINIAPYIIGCSLLIFVIVLPAFLLLSMHIRGNIAFTVEIAELSLLAIIWKLTSKKRRLISQKIEKIQAKAEIKVNTVETNSVRKTLKRF